MGDFGTEIGRVETTMAILRKSGTKAKVGPFRVKAKGGVV